MLENELTTPLPATRLNSEVLVAWPGAGLQEVFSFGRWLHVLGKALNAFVWIALMPLCPSGQGPEGCGPPGNLNKLWKDCPVSGPVWLPSRHCQEDYCCVCVFIVWTYASPLRREGEASSTSLRNCMVCVF